MDGEHKSFIGGFLEQLRFPWLFVLLACLWLLDMFVPDPLPLVDELILATLTVMAAAWRRPIDAGKPPVKNVTPDLTARVVPSEDDANRDGASREGAAPR